MLYIVSVICENQNSGVNHKSFILIFCVETFCVLYYSLSHSCSLPHLSLSLSPFFSNIVGKYRKVTEKNTHGKYCYGELNHQIILLLLCVFCLFVLSIFKGERRVIQKVFSTHVNLRWFLRQKVILNGKKT